MKQNLFRSIRHKLLLRRPEGYEGHVISGKLLRYLSYAVGEVILIIVGILIALKINDWNENRKAQVELDEYIFQLKENVKDTSERARRASENLKTQAMDGKFVLDFLKLSEYDQNELEAFESGLRGLSFYPDPQINIGLLGELLAGEKHIISRDHNLASLASNKMGQVNSSLTVIDTLRKKLDVKWETVEKLRAVPNDGIPGLEFEFDLERMKNSQDFLYEVQNVLTLKYTTATRFDSISAILDDFLALLEEYEK